jgi:type 1 glutamine amidotransferase
MSAGGVEPATGGAIASPGGAGGSGGAPISVVVFSKTAIFRHDSIEAGVTAISELGEERDWEVLATEDPAIFAENGLRDSNVVVFLNTTGDVLNDEQQAGFEQFIRAGNGYVGIHAATDTEYDWPWYGELVGAYFREHPETQTADVIVEDATHAATRGLPNPWRRTDEWYGFQMNPRSGVNVLLALDEASYSPEGSNMGGDHPIAWFHEHDGGRAFYTGLGHTIESYSDAQFLAHLAGAIEWAAGG